MSEFGEIRVRVGDRMDGSCNACTRSGPAFSRTTVVDFERGMSRSGISWRVCAKCRRKLINLLVAQQSKDDAQVAAPQPGGSDV